MNKSTSARLITIIILKDVYYAYVTHVYIFLMPNTDMEKGYGGSKDEI